MPLRYTNLLTTTMVTVRRMIIKVVCQNRLRACVTKQSYHIILMANYKASIGMVSLIILFIVAHTDNPSKDKPVKYYMLDCIEYKHGHS